jgi:hypothetical protein
MHSHHMVTVTGMDMVVGMVVVGGTIMAEWAQERLWRLVQRLDWEDILLLMLCSMDVVR